MKRAARAVALAGFALGAVACVTTGQHDAVVGERDALAERVQRLDASTQALTAERDRLANELEDQRTQRDGAMRDAERRRGECEAQLVERSQKLDELHATYEGLIRDLEGQLAQGNTQIEQLREGLRTSLPAELLFRSGSADLSPEGEGVVADVAKNLRRDAYAAYQILVEGHTDGVAVRGALAQRYPTNWELAGARAARVVRALEANGVDPERLAAVSRGAEQPLGPDDTPEGRAANRRIEIRLIPLPGASPASPPPAPADAAPPEAPAPAEAPAEAAP
jgi:chemotaxis protein MotB